MDKIKLDVSVHGDLTSQPWEDGWDTIHGLAAAMREGVISDDSRVEGKLRVSVASRSEVAAINERFGDVVETSEEVQQFEDREVAKLYPLISVSAFKAKTIGASLKANTDIRVFDEFSECADTIVQNGAFQNCNSLESIGLDKVTRIGSTGRSWSNCDCFNGCSRLKSVVALKCTIIEQRAFSNCASIKFVLLPSIVQFGYSGEYSYQTGVFQNDISIELADFGKNIVADYSSDRALFVGCKADAINIVCRADAPFTIAQGNLGVSPKAIFVPSPSLATYKSASNWSTYSSKIYAISGPEWIAEFGSADEYADIDKYVTDPAEREKIRAAYAAN